MKRHTGSIIVSLVLALLLGSTGIVQAEQMELTGREIMEKVYDRYTGEDRTSNLEMILINRHGDQRVRKLVQHEKDFGDVEKKIMFFTAPSDVYNTSFMNWSHADGSDDQWIYLPALGRIRRISAEDKSDHFMGSDFTYDDLGNRHIDDDNHHLIGTEEIDGEYCYIVENTPVDGEYMYSRTVTWVIRDTWIPLQREFYDPEGDLLKVLRNLEYEEIDGIYTIVESKMENVQTGHRTVLRTTEVEYSTGIDEGMFTERMMRRGI